ncbi:hypothetical protein ABIE63_000601 [Limibacillus sp. MBR-115]|jgi:hypothetical protein
MTAWAEAVVPGELSVNPRELPGTVYEGLVLDLVSGVVFGLAIGTRVDGRMKHG